MVLSVRWARLATEGPVFTYHQNGGKGGMFFLGGSTSEESPPKGELYEIDCKLTANDGVEVGGS